MEDIGLPHHVIDRLAQRCLQRDVGHPTTALRSG